MTTTFKPTAARGRALAGEVADLIEANPEHHNQNWWVLTPHGASNTVTLDTVVETCGTTACAAGWAALAVGHTLEGERVVEADEHVEALSARLLGFEDEADSWSIFHCYDDEVAVARLRAWAAGAASDDLYTIGRTDDE